MHVGCWEKELSEMSSLSPLALLTTLSFEIGKQSEAQGGGGICLRSHS